MGVFLRVCYSFSPYFEVVRKDGGVPKETLMGRVKSDILGKDRYCNDEGASDILLVM